MLPDVVSGISFAYLMQKLSCFYPCISQMSTGFSFPPFPQILPPFFFFSFSFVFLKQRTPGCAERDPDRDENSRIPGWGVRQYEMNSQGSVFRESAWISSVCTQHQLL